MTDAGFEAAGHGRRAEEQPRAAETYGGIPPDSRGANAGQVRAAVADPGVARPQPFSSRACANPPAQRHGPTDGHTPALPAPRAAAFNRGRRSAALNPGLAARLRVFSLAGRLPATPGEAGVPAGDLPEPARLAAGDRARLINPRPLDAAAVLESYRCAS